jgi:hypothetical protein
MPTLKYWDAGQNAYVALPAISSSAPSNMVSTIITAPTAAASPYTITHNFGTTNVMVQAWDTVTNDLIVVRMHVADANHIQVYFEQNAPNNVNVLVVGGAGSLAPAPVVAARARNVSATQSFPGNTVLTYDTLEYDTHGGFNIATGTYTVPAGQPGDYLVTGEYASTGLPAGQWAGIMIQRNGGIYANGTQYAGATGSVACHISTVVRCNAGDTLTVLAIPNTTISNYNQAAGNYQYMTVHRIFPGLQAAGAFLPPQVPPPTGFNSYTDPSGEVWASRNGSAWRKARDALGARMYRNAAYNSGASGTFITMPFDTILEDVYGCCVAGASASFTCPIPGHYLVSARIDVIPNVTLCRCILTLYKNGAEFNRGGDMTVPAANAVAGLLLVEDVTAVAGDVL